MTATIQPGLRVRDTQSGSIFEVRRVHSADNGSSALVEFDRPVVDVNLATGERVEEHTIAYPDRCRSLAYVQGLMTAV